jgi:hypothetical protein
MNRKSLDGQILNSAEADALDTIQDSFGNFYPDFTSYPMNGENPCRSYVHFILPNCLKLGAEKISDRRDGDDTTRDGFYYMMLDFLINACQQPVGSSIIADRSVARSMKTPKSAEKTPDESDDEEKNKMLKGKIEFKGLYMARSDNTVGPKIDMTIDILVGERGLPDEVTEEYAKLLFKENLRRCVTQEQEDRIFGTDKNGWDLKDKFEERIVNGITEKRRVKGFEMVEDIMMDPRHKNMGEKGLLSSIFAPTNIKGFLVTFMSKDSVDIKKYFSTAFLLEIQSNQALYMEARRNMKAASKKKKQEIDKMVQSGVIPVSQNLSHLSELKDPNLMLAKEMAPKFISSHVIRSSDDLLRKMTKYRR